MVHVIFDPSLTGYQDLFLIQTGTGASNLIGENQTGADPLTYTIFRGAPPYQRGWVNFNEN